MLNFGHESLNEENIDDRLFKRLRIDKMYDITWSGNKHLKSWVRLNLKSIQTGKVMC